VNNNIQTFSMLKGSESSILQKGLDFIIVWIKTIMAHFID